MTRPSLTFVLAALFGACTAVASEPATGVFRARSAPALARDDPGSGVSLRENPGLEGVALVRFDPPGRASSPRVLGVVAPGVYAVRVSSPGAAPDLPAGAELVTVLRLEHKLSPEIGHGGSLDGASLLDVWLFRDADPDALVAALEPGVALVRHVKRSVPRRLTLEVPAGTRSTVARLLAGDPAVQFIEPRAPLEVHNDQAAWIVQSYDRVQGPMEAAAADPQSYATSGTLWAHGLTGEGQIVAVADTGLEHDTCFFDDPGHPVVVQTVAPPAPLTLDLAHRKVVAVNEVIPGAADVEGAFRHGTHVSASLAGDDLAHLAGLGPWHDHGDGLAPGARILFEDISGQVNSICTTTIAVPSVQDLLEQEYLAGARVSSNSWGSSATWSAATVEVDAAVAHREDLVAVFSAGNNGSGGVAGQSLCKNCVTVGASENYDPEFLDALGILDPENMAAFSSRGPTPDGRLRPDVVAPGYLVASNRFPTQYVSDASNPVCDAQDPQVCFPGFGGCYFSDSSVPCSVVDLLGTSMSTPLVAGMATLARQYFLDGFYPSGFPDRADGRTPSAALVKAILINSARNMTGRLLERRGTPVDHGPLADAPSQVQGWGRVMLDDALFFDGDARHLTVVDRLNAEGLAQDQIFETMQTVAVGEPLKLTLVWTDAPGEPLGPTTLIHDLDLEVVAPDGTLFRGNQWTADLPEVVGDKQSAPNPVGHDTTNNVEGILIPAPLAGVYTIRVEARNVAGDGMRDVQGFALVATGSFEEAGVVAEVPDGELGEPLLASRVDPGGESIAIEWDIASCPSSGYHLLHGSLESVTPLTLVGSECALGTDGAFVWSAVPPGNLWFLVVGNDGGVREGSWGQGADGPRSGGQASGSCGFEMIDETGTCR